MHVRRLELIDYRSYRHAATDLEPGPSVLVGPNGAGKTNLIEALGYLATLGSHRVAADAPLVRNGADHAIIRAAIVHNGRELLAELDIQPGKTNRARLGRAPLPRPRDLLGALRVILFAPEDLTLIRGEPTERRRYLDDLLVARNPRYAAVRADYDRVLKQRNTLLRTAYLTRKVTGKRHTADTGDLRTLQAWDNQLADHGADLLAGRLTLVNALAPYLTKAYDAVSQGRGRATITYKSSLDTPDTDPLTPDRELLAARIANALTTTRDAEIDRGSTLVGPQRDDLTLHLGDLPAKGYASHGESWSYALALRLAAHDLLRAEGTEPVLILDDVFAELDTTRRHRLAELVDGAAQVIVTCAVPDDVPPALAGARYDVAEGHITRVI